MSGRSQPLLQNSRPLLQFRYSHHRSIWARACSRMSHVWTIRVPKCARHFVYPSRKSPCIPASHSDQTSQVFCVCSSRHGCSVCVRDDLCWNCTHHFWKDRMTSRKSHHNDQAYGLSGQTQIKFQSLSPEAMDRPRLSWAKITRWAFGGIGVPELSQSKLSSGIVHAAGISDVCSNLTGKSCIWARSGLTP